MLYIKNVPQWERLTRIGLSIVMAVYGLGRIGGALGWIIVTAAAGILLTSILGFCPVCALAGRRLRK
ncbi:MAG TPA: DUF2892 domain-containing protein [Acidiferrobacter sp.]|nr:DUF2892 domain-containing protein [Acidiferrobacter sp.]